jgi:hypothetical protein
VGSTTSGCRCKVGLAVVYEVRRGFYFYCESVELAVQGCWGEGEAVFVGDEICDFVVGAHEIRGVFGEIDAAAGGFGEFVERLVGLGESFFYFRAV